LSGTTPSIVCRVLWLRLSRALNDDDDADDDDGGGGGGCSGEKEGWQVRTYLILGNVPE
jgi:hypothetical protein